MDWLLIIPFDYSTYPKEGIDVLVSDGIHFDVAWYLRSSEYTWQKVNLKEDTCNEFTEFTPIKWKLIE